MADNANSKPASAPGVKKRTPLPSGGPVNRPPTKNQHNAAEALNLLVCGPFPLAARNSKARATTSQAPEPGTKEADNSRTASQGSTSQGEPSTKASSLEASSLEASSLEASSPEASSPKASSPKASPQEAPSQETSRKKKSPKPTEWCTCVCRKCTRECGPEGKWITRKLQVEHNRAEQITENGRALPWEQSCIRCKKMKNPDHRCMVWDTYKSCGHCVSMKEGCSLNPESKKKKRSSAAQEKAETESNTVLDDKKKPPAKCRKTRRKASPRTEARASEPDNEPLEATKVTPPEERSGPAPKANSQGLQLGMVFDAFTEPLSSIDAAGELASMPASTTGTEGETRLRILAAAACAFLPLEATEGTRSEERSGPAPKANPEGPQGGVVFDAFTEPLSSREIAGEPAQMPANLAGTEGDTAFQALATTAGAFLESMDSAAPARHPSGWTPINMPRRAPVNSPANTAANDFIDRSMSISSLLN